MDESNRIAVKLMNKILSDFKITSFPSTPKPQTFRNGTIRK
jgi:hypothetical protein